MNRSTLALCMLLCSIGTLPAKVASTNAYQAQRARMNKQLNSIGARPASTVRSASLDMPVPNAAAVQKQLPTTLDPASLSETHKKDLSHLLNLIAKTYGKQHTGMIAQTLLASPDRLRAVLTLVHTRRAELPKILQHPSSLQLLISDPVKLLNMRLPSRQPAIGTLMQFLVKTKKLFSVKEWGGLMRQFVGRTFSKMWDQVWHIVSGAITVVIGRQNIYELDETGKIKVDARQQKVPKMTEEYTINQMGQPETRMVPSKWYSIVEDKHSLLGQIAQSGINQATMSALRSLDRLLFRPIVHKMLNVPEWKLSHTHYLLYMHEKKFPNESILSPAKLAAKIGTTRRPDLIFASGLPFNLRKIMNTKDPHLKSKALQVAITKHLWRKYEPIWQEANTRKTTTGDDGPQVEMFPPTKVAIALEKGAKTRNFGSELLDEARKVGKDMLLAKLQDGPLIQYVIYANMAMSIPRHLFSSFGSGKNLETSLSGDDKNIPQYIDILEALTRAIRSDQEDTSTTGAKDGHLRPINIEFSTGAENESFHIELSVATQNKLLRVQEKLIEKYRPFLQLSGEPYEVYLKKLLLPRIIFAVLPTEAKEKLGITNLAQASKKAKQLEDYFEISFNTIQALCAALAMVKKFENITSFAGHYVEVADTIDQLLISIHVLLNSLKPLPGMKHTPDDWGKRFKTVLRGTYGKHIGSSKRLKHGRDSWPHSWLYLGDEKAFSATQRQQIKHAWRKAGGSTDILLLADRSAILEYINADESELAAAQEKLTEPMTFTAKDAQGTVISGRTPSLIFGNGAGATADYVARANAIQHHRNKTGGLFTLRINERMTIGELKRMVNDKESTTVTSDRSVAATRATAVILASLYPLSVHKKDVENLFFTDGTKANNARVADSIKKLDAEITGNLAATLGHVQAGIGTIHKLYMDFGMREIIGAFDEHYVATGEKLTQLPLRTLGKIVAREGMAHAVGLGADKMLHKMMGPVMSQISRLQGNALLGGGAVQGMLMGKINQFMGDAGGRTNAYRAARSMVRNLFTYGSTALSGDNFMGSVAMKMMPGGGGPQAEQMEVMMHAKMAAESGKDVLPIMKKKMKDMGIDPAMVAGMAGMGGMAGMDDLDGMNDEEMMAGMGGMGEQVRGPADGDQMPTGMPSKQLQAALQKAGDIAKKDGEDAALKYLQEIIPTLSESDRALLKQMGLDAE